jgi:hypothetical protein
MLVAPNQPGPGAPTTSPGQALSPVATASVTWPDAIVDDRDVAANAALNTEKARLTAHATSDNAAITAINAITGGAVSIGSVQPNSVVHNVATPITIQGGNFSTGSPAVTVQGVACTAVVVVDDGKLTCTTAATLSATPAGGPGADVKVTIGANSATLVGAMTIT